MGRLGYDLDHMGYLWNMYGIYMNVYSINHTYQLKPSPSVIHSTSLSTCSTCCWFLGLPSTSSAIHLSDDHVGRVRIEFGHLIPPGFINSGDPIFYETHPSFKLFHTVSKLFLLLRNSQSYHYILAVDIHDPYLMMISPWRV